VRVTAANHTLWSAIIKLRCSLRRAIYEVKHAFLRCCCRLSAPLLPKQPGDL